MEQIKFINSITSIDKEDWDQILPKNDYPFLKYEFLELLENTNCVGKNTGWHPAHIAIEKESKLVGAMPLYIKTDSSGEFVFDYTWANAFYQHGLDYYPKLVSSIPFTPATGPRILHASNESPLDIFSLILKGVEKLSKENNISSWHVLFPEEKDIDVFSEKSLSVRNNAQFIWFNENFNNFDDFLDTFRSRHRKNVKKEREKISSQGIVVETYSGEELNKDLMMQFYEFYLSTNLKRSGHLGYLTKEFFEVCLERIMENIVLVLARDKNSKLLVGGSMFFKDQENLYGRYWGCSAEYDCLHFECCYYQGIEFAIKNQLLKFDPGVQGEHKIKRGFKPTITYSAHWISEPNFKDAIENFVSKEEKHIKAYVDATSKYLPFKNI